MKKECEECEGEGYTLTHNEDGEVSPKRCEECKGSGYAEQQLNNIVKPYYFKMKNCSQMSPQEMSDTTLKKTIHKYLRRAKENAMMLYYLKKEVDNRQANSEKIETFYTINNYNIFQIMTHATILGVNLFNRMNNGEEEE